MAANSIDYDSLAQQHGAASVDYDALAAQHGAVSTPAKSEAAAQPSFWDTLKREGKAFTGTIAGLPAGVYHAFNEPPTAEEKQRWGLGDKPDQVEKMALGAMRMSYHPVITAGQWYGEAAQGKVPNAYEQALSVAPEAVGSAAGNVVAGKLVESIPGAAKATGRVAPPIVRAVVRGANAALEKAPGTIGGATGAGIGGYFGGHVGAEIGGIAGTMAGKEILPQVRIPGEGFGLPNRVTGGPQVVPEPPAEAAPPAAPITTGAEPDIDLEMRLGTTQPPEPPPLKGVGEKLGTPAEEAKFRESFVKRDTAKKALESGVQPPPNAVLPDTSPANVERLLNEGTGGQPLKPGVPLKNQAAAAKLPEGFTPVESSALKGYKYDPATREFESITTGGQHYIHGDVSPEEAQAFAEAESKGKAWQDIRKNPLVAKVVNGKRAATRPLKDLAELKNLQTATESEPAVSSEDLTDILNQSLKQLRDLKSLKNAQ